MTRPLPSPKVIPLPVNTSFSQDVLDWFTFKRAGHMAKWLFSSPKYPGDKACGALVWGHLIEEAQKGSPYYIFNDEQQVIKAALPTIRAEIKKPLTLIDLGPGSKDAVISKTCPIMSELSDHVQQYISIDSNQDFINTASHVISNLYPNVLNGGLCLDFLDDSFRYPSKERLTVTLLFGITLCNMLIDPREKELPLYLLRSYFLRLRSHFGDSDGYLIITQDTNQDVDKLEPAYRGLTEYYLTLPHRIKRDLDVFGDYDPEAFEVKVEFIQDSKALAVSFVVKKDMKFTVNGRFVSLVQGEQLYMGNSFKFDRDTFLSTAQEAGFISVKTIECPANPCLLHILKTSR